MSAIPLRLTLVTETYPPEVNGVALTLHALQRGLSALGHSVEVVRPGPQPRSPVTEGQCIVPGGPVPRYPGLRFGYPAAGRLRERWEQQRPDAVYVATEGPLGWSAIRAARALGVPVASGFHTRFDDYVTQYGARWLAPLALAWLRHVHNQSQLTLVPTRELEAFLRPRGFRNVELLRRAVDTERFHPARRDPRLREAWGLRRDQLAVLHVGRLAREKNLALLVRAFRALQQQRPHARCIVVGAGPERAALQQAHPDFVFAGLQQGTALAAHYASGDLFLFPSLSETFGNVTLEAMASGLAVVAFDYGAAREHLQHGCSGAALPPGDAEAFIAATVQLGCDDAARRACAAAARRQVEDLRPQSVAHAFATRLRALARQVPP